MAKPPFSDRCDENGNDVLESAGTGVLCFMGSRRIFDIGPKPVEVDALKGKSKGEAKKGEGHSKVLTKARSKEVAETTRTLARQLEINDNTSHASDAAHWDTDQYFVIRTVVPMTQIQYV